MLGSRVASRPLLATTAFVVSIAAAGCDEDETVDPGNVTCPNAVPEAGASCPSEGLVCNYFTGCNGYYPATCGTDRKWSFTDGCELPEGGASAEGGSAASGGGDGGSGGSSSAPAGSGVGGAGGSGGAGMGGSGGVGGSG